MFDELRSWFANAEMPTTQLQCWGNLVVIVLEGPTDLALIQYRTSVCGCFQMNEESSC